MAENLGPLTAAFTPPSGCASYQTELYNVVDATGAWYAQGPIDLGSCFPSGYSSELTQYYSPGVCPSGYKPACVDYNQVGSLTETIYTCCPARFSYTCHFSGHPGWGGCYYDIPDTSSTLTSLYGVEDGVTWSLSDVTDAYGAINAQSIQVRFRPIDFVETTAPTPSQTSSSSETVARTAPLPPATDTGDAETAGSLGPGALAGICVGVILGLIVIVGAIIFAFMRKKRLARPVAELGVAGPNRPATVHIGSQPGVYSVPPSMADTASQVNSQYSRLGEHGQYMYEHRSELSGQADVAELDATPQGPQMRKR